MGQGDRRGFSSTSATAVTYERLRQTIAKRMRMSPIDQPLMLMELLSHGFARQQPARSRHRSWPGGSWKRMVGGEEVPETPATLKSSGYRPCRHGAW